MRIFELEDVPTVAADHSVRVDVSHLDQGRINMVLAEDWGEPIVRHLSGLPLHQVSHFFVEL